MKFIRTCFALAFVGAAVSAQAESSIVTGAAVATPGAVARLDFRVNVPKVLYLRVGSGVDFSDGITIDEVVFNVPVASVLTPGANVNGVGSAGVITSRIFGNVGNVTLGTVGSGTGLVSGADTILWSEILPSTIGGAFSNPAINSSATIPAAGRIVNRSGTWAFAYDNSATVPEGSYLGQVTYTATML